MDQNVQTFIDALKKSAGDGTFVKLSLGHYKGSEEGLQKIRVRRIETKKGPVFSAVFRYEKRDVTKSLSLTETADMLSLRLGRDLLSGHLFTTTGDLRFEANKRGNSRIVRSRPTDFVPPSATHDRQKREFVDPKAGYLHALGITTGDGKVRDKQQGKWRQINKFVEIVDGLFDSSGLKDRDSISIVDMGSGKGYLTFAVYDHFKNDRGLDLSVAGVETRKELVEFCNKIAAASRFERLNFEQGTIADHPLGKIDVLIALHACDTASDDALYKGIRAKAAIIIAAPCCHQELRPQLRSPPELGGLLRHGIMVERMAEMVTDSLRALLLELNGYETKVFDFVPVEHTPKNTLIVGVKRDSVRRRERARKEIDSLKTAFRIKRQRLEVLLEYTSDGRSPGTS